MMKTKDDFITEVSSKLVGIIGIENTKKVKELLILELRNIKLESEETSLVVSTDARASIITKFIACKKLTGCTDRTLKAYLDEYSKFFRIIDKNVEDITTDDIRYYLALARRNGAKEITIDNYRRYLNSLFEWCQNEDIIIKNPVKKIDKIRAEKSKRVAFTDIEIEKMRSQLTNGKTYTARMGKEHEKELRLRNIAIFETLLSTGCRVGGIVNMNRNQVENGEDELIVCEKGKKERIVYLNAKAKVAIENYLKARKDNHEALFTSVNVFSGNEIQRISIAGIECMIRNNGERCGVEAYPHKFRRTAATLAARKGMPIEQIQRMLGHATLNTTQIYVNVSDNDVKLSHEKYLS